MSFNFSFKLLLFILVFPKKFIFNSTLKSNENNKLEEIMLTDIENAFKGIVNTTEKLLHEKIIPQMYNFKRSHIFSFKIPNKQNELGYSMIFTDRSELMQPIFPNLTINSEQILLKKRRYQAAIRHVEGSNNRNKTTTNVNIWSILGLDGWSGEITDATDLLESEHKDILQKDKFEKKETTEKLNTELTTEMSNLKNRTILDEADFESIFIARVNDPFGFSTKWSYRNQTSNSIKNGTREDGRLKRDIVELYSMIKCATGCEPLVYQSYGCFCGFLGNGIAVDSIDQCCRMHDKCYEQSNCVSYLQYFVPYVWKCYRNKPLCALDHGEYGGPTSCAALLCYCDMRLSICLRKFQCPIRKAVCTTSIARKLQNLFF